jgi:3-hydroxyacyl-[acyl-carrier-protein] dehydratase
VGRDLRPARNHTKKATPKMLLNDLYTFNDFKADGNSIAASVDINWSHYIFNGHFPGRPVFPGVCMMQMVKEALETHFGKELKLTKAADLKFLVMIQPQNPVVQLGITTSLPENMISADARLFEGTTTFFKFKGTFVER